MLVADRTLWEDVLFHEGAMLSDMFRDASARLLWNFGETAISVEKNGLVRNGEEWRDRVISDMRFELGARVAALAAKGSVIRLNYNGMPTAAYKDILHFQVNNCGFEYSALSLEQLSKDSLVQGAVAEIHRMMVRDSRRWER